MCGLKSLEKVIITKNSPRPDLKGRWVLQQSDGGTFYLSKISEDGSVEDMCVWAYVDLNAGVNFSKRPIHEFTGHSTYTLATEEEIKHSISAIGEAMLLAYRERVSLDQPNKDHLPNENRCEKCKSTDITAIPRQMDTSDEPPDIFYVCNNCRNVDRRSGWF